MRAKYPTAGLATLHFDDPWEAPAVGRIRSVGSTRIQVVSRPVEVSAAKTSLHAIVDLDAVEQLFGNDGLGQSGVVFVVDANHDVLLGTPGVALPERHQAAAQLLTKMCSLGASPTLEKALANIKKTL